MVYIVHTHHTHGERKMPKTRISLSVSESDLAAFDHFLAVLSAWAIAAGTDPAVVKQATTRSGFLAEAVRMVGGNERAICELVAKELGWEKRQLDLFEQSAEKELARAKSPR